MSSINPAIATEKEDLVTWGDGIKSGRHGGGKIFLSLSLVIDWSRRAIPDAPFLTVRKGKYIWGFIRFIDNIPGQI